MSELKLGQIITTPQNRDAIHVAVAPVTAYENLFPGQHVGLVEGGCTHATLGSKPIGVVDPYLRYSVLKGEMFWLFLYPQTVTGLRHDWSHPAFVESVDGKADAEKWVQAFCESHGFDFSTIKEDARKGEFYAGQDLEYDQLAAERETLYAKLTILTGETYTPDLIKNAYFRCSC